MDELKELRSMDEKFVVVEDFNTRVLQWGMDYINFRGNIRKTRIISFHTGAHNIPASAGQRNYHR